MEPPGRKRIVELLECIPPKNRKEVLEELLELHPSEDIRKQLRSAKQVQTVLASNEQSDLGIGVTTYPIQELVRRESGRFFDFEAGGRGAAIVVLLIDNERCSLVLETRADFEIDYTKLLRRSPRRRWPEILVIVCIILGGWGLYHTC